MLHKHNRGGGGGIGRGGGREGGRGLIGKRSSFQGSVHEDTNDGSGGGGEVLLVEEVGGREGGRVGGRGDELGEEEGGVFGLVDCCHFHKSAGRQGREVGGGVELIRGGFFREGSKETEGEGKDLFDEQRVVEEEVTIIPAI
jgi:hypothetical protein